MSWADSYESFSAYLDTLKDTAVPYTQDDIDEMLTGQVPLSGEEPDVYGPERREGENYGNS